MPRILLADDASLVNDHLATRLHEELQCPVDVFESAEGCLAAPVPAEGWDVAVIDLSFKSTLNGADVIVDLHQRSPATKLVVYTQGDPWASELLRDTWEAVSLACVLGKSMPIAEFVRSVERVIRDGTAPVDPILRPILPEPRSPWRRLENYGRLVQHAGHAKLWRALIEAPGEPSYRDLALATGLSVHTVRNYRGQLLGELRLHHLDDPSMRAMQQFAKRCRPFLQPALLKRLPPS